MLATVATVWALATAAPVLEVDPTKAPHGTYCGSYAPYLDHLSLNVTSPTKFSALAKIMGQEFGCRNEDYTFFPSNNTLYVPGIFNQSDCLGKIAAGAGLDPTGLTITYDPSKDSADVSVMGVDVTFDKASCKTALGNTTKAPHGVYCGSYAPYLDHLSLNVNSPTKFSALAKIMGQEFGCRNEDYTFFPSNNTLYAPGIFNQSDCLGKIAAGAGLDPTGLTITYDPSKDSADASVMGADVTFDKPSCKTA